MKSVRIVVAASAAALALVASGGPLRAEPPAPRGRDDEVEPGVHVRLGYWFPLFDFSFSNDAEATSGTRLDDDGDLSMTYDFVFPTVEADVTIQPYGRIELSFANLIFEGNRSALGDIVFGDAAIEQGESIDAEFELRTGTLYGTVFITLAETITGGIVLGTRYLHTFASIDSDDSLEADDDIIDTFVPILGLSVEGTIYDPFSFFARIIWLDFRYGDNDVEVSYREWQLGARFAITEYFSVGAEWYHLQFDIEDGGSEVRARLRGPRFFAMVSF